MNNLQVRQPLGPEEVKDLLPNVGREHSETAKRYETQRQLPWLQLGLGLLGAGLNSWQPVGGLMLGC